MGGEEYLDSCSVCPEQQGTPGPASPPEPRCITRVNTRVRTGCDL